MEPTRVIAKTKYMNTELILCECSSMEHQMVFVHFDEEPDVIYVQVHLAKRPFWKRVGSAIRYILGRRSRYGDWDEIIVSRERLKKALYEQDKTQEVQG